MYPNLIQKTKSQIQNFKGLEIKFKKKITDKIVYKYLLFIKLFQGPGDPVF